ncbi:hypothetical protein CspHIS471_0106690 [Cutaneotrichosporon sp. HIS471]|nr:hypothetical protein CspHIS471_0106690 [Cutaneotrichosporon sp. HIS471]
MLILSDVDRSSSSAPKTLHLTKVQATGNDFLLLSDPEGLPLLQPHQIAALCDRRFGIGADGVIRVIRSRHIPEGAANLEQDPTAEWFMDYVNADGSIAEMCGNGVRAFVRYLIYSGLNPLRVGERIAVGTRAGLRWVERLEEGFRIDMGNWKITGHHLVKADGITIKTGLGINLGNPHIVVSLNANELDALQLGNTPILDPPAINGANIEFVVTESIEVGRIRMRVSERGVGETLSCGTGSVAAALAAREWAGGAPHAWEVCIPGGRVQVAMTGGEDERVTLTGPAEVVFDGEFTLPLM